MANDTETAQVSLDPDSEAANAISTTVECQESTSDKHARALHGVGQGLPSHVVKDLVSIGVRSFTILRVSEFS
jgi:hypothetical protein